MGDNMKKVRSGDQLNIPAATFNTFIDASRDFLSRQNNLNQQHSRDTRSSGIILVKNASGEDRARFEILGITEPIINAADNEEQFKNRVALKGETPTADDHTGKFVILLEPLKTDGIGMAMALGICPVKITVGNDAHSHADVKDGEGTSLQSGFYGCAQILWKEEGAGEKWAVVRLNAMPPRNLQTDNPYIIDRTVEADDLKAWNPADESPSDWEVYDSVKLITGFLRYDSTAGTLKHVRQEFWWSAFNAPVIPQAYVVTADTGSC